MQDNNYYNKRLYIKPQYKDVYEHLQKKGRNSTDYICELVRLDMKNETIDLKLLKNQVDELLNMTRYEYKGDGIIEEVPIKEESQASIKDIDVSF